MFCKVVCSNQIAFQEICDHLTCLNILYLAEAPKLEISIKREPEFVSKLLQDNGYDAQVLVLR
ncbi:hypothetical protein [Ammoniphilus sp. CFH 90114]|uniref:hypothetical protein n=1 Tax=Ammoniphilus sp. CFH 90114 TaxID=2493665 RepID=UPI00100E3489|nr:hypothetical protein [Ammoniphilus sp. CFH 90114]RXT15238.1 hypothetical protein EIZ39_03235 [Ammoniphilus sp. CFH 90114]